MRRKGFTLIELMIVVAIIGVLAAIAIPKFANLIRKSAEGSAKANLGQIRSALSIYYSDLDGHFPSNLAALTISGKYLSNVPQARAPNYHGESSVAVETQVADDTGGWLYNNVLSDGNLGTIWVNCTHTDTGGRIWTQF